MEYSYQFRIYPTEEQKVLMAKTFGCCRYVFNYFLNRRKTTYKETGKGCSKARKNMKTQNRIRALREDRDLRQIDVSQATGIDQKTLSNYETGRTRPDSEALILLADFFHVSIDYLVGRTVASITTDKEIVSAIEGVQRQLESIKLYLSDRC